MFNEIRISDIQDTITADKNFINSFYVADQIYVTKVFELRQLTFSNLIYTSLRNEIKLRYFKILLFICKLGFIDIEEGYNLSLKNFTFNFIGTLAKRERVKLNKKYVKMMEKYV